MISADKLEMLEDAIETAYNDTDYNTTEYEIMRKMQDLLDELRG
jgi:DNA-binding protein YbaB